MTSKKLILSNKLPDCSNSFKTVNDLSGPYKTNSEKISSTKFFEYGFMTLNRTEKPDSLRCRMCQNRVDLDKKHFFYFSHSFRGCGHAKSQSLALVDCQGQKL